MTVMTSFPLSEVVQSQDAMGRTTKWVLELMDQGIMYASRTAIKSQVLANFITEWTEVQHHRRSLIKSTGRCTLMDH